MEARQQRASSINDWSGLKWLRRGATGITPHQGGRQRCEARGCRIRPRPIAILQTHPAWHRAAMRPHAPKETPTYWAGMYFHAFCNCVEIAARGLRNLRALVSNEYACGVGALVGIIGDVQLPPRLSRRQPCRRPQTHRLAGGSAHMTQKDTALNVSSTPMQGQACTAWMVITPKPAKKRPKVFLKLVATSRAPNNPLPPQSRLRRCKTMWTWWPGFNSGTDHWSVYPGSPFIIQQPATRARQAQTVRDCTPPTPRHWTPTLPSSKRADRWPSCAKTGLRDSRSSCHPPSAPGAGAVRPQLRGQERLWACARHGRRRAAAFCHGTYAVWYPIIPRPEAHDRAQAPENHGQQGRQVVAARHADGQVQQAHQDAQG